MPYYCIENILLDPETLAYVCNCSTEEVQSVILSAFKAKRKIIFQKNKFFEFLTDSLTAEHMTFNRLKSFDASHVVADVLHLLGRRSVQDILPEYLEAAQKANRLGTLIPDELLHAISPTAKK